VHSARKIETSSYDPAAADSGYRRSRPGRASPAGRPPGPFSTDAKREAHPVLLYTRHGVPFVLSTDDAGVSRNNLSHEYMLYAARYQPDYDALKRLSYDSLRYSFLPEDVKRDEVARLDARFAEFEARIARLPRAPR
jgi:adenosine deaminase/adenosine deaminase CECR1